MGWGGVGGGILYHPCPYVSPVCLSLRPSHPVRLILNTNGFRLISFEKISVLDSNLIHRYIIIKCRSSSIQGKSTSNYGSYCSFSTLKNVFSLISFGKVSVLDSNFIHRCIILKYKSCSI